MGRSLKCCDGGAALIVSGVGAWSRQITKAAPGDPAGASSIRHSPFAITHYLTGNQPRFPVGWQWRMANGEWF